MKKLISYIILGIPILSCTTTHVIAHSYTGNEINSRFKILQSVTTSYEYEDGRTLDKNANIYKIRKNECAIVAILNNESNFSGYEDIIYFSSGKMKYGYTRSFFSIFIDKNEINKSKKFKYDEFINDLDNHRELQNDFKNYKKLFNRKTLSECNEKN